MRKATTLLLLASLFVLGRAQAQETTAFTLPVTDAFTDPFAVDRHNGVRGISGPFDLDQDGKMEILLSEYSGGGRVHVIENNGDTWELVYSTPFQDSTSFDRNGRYATGGDLDGDGNMEIISTAGNAYSATNPNADLFKIGMYVYEHTGEDNDFGTLPASILTFEDDTEVGPPTDNRAEVFEVRDVDGDGKQELLIPANGPGSWDYFFVYSVDGQFEPNGAGTTFETWVQETRIEPRVNTALGGGSPTSIYPADLDGDGDFELSMHTWNNFNFFNADIPAANTYEVADPASTTGSLKGVAEDHLAVFGGTVVDINQDGDDEVFYPRWQSFASRAVSVLNYEDGEDVLSITPDQFVTDLLTELTNNGLTAGDLDGDGNMELIGAGPSYSASRYNAGEPSQFIVVAEFTGGPGGDPEDPNNYEIHHIDTSLPVDSTFFNILHRDSLGTMTTMFDPASPEVPTSKIAYLGDVNGDGSREVAVGFQAVPDSIYIYDEVWNVDSLRYDRTLREAVPSPARAMVRIVSFESYSVAVEQDVVLPSDYKLSANYPNPFNPTTTFSFTLPVDKRVSVRVYDVTGRLVRTLVDGRQYARGTYDVTWDGTNAAGTAVASGTYVYSLEYGNFRQSRTMVLVK